MPLKNTEDILQWFMDKSPAWGFAVKAESLQLLANQVLAFEKKGQKVTIARAKISGTLHVTAQDLFKKSFELGIGRAKAFGCGFLQIIPVI